MSIRKKIDKFSALCRKDPKLRTYQQESKKKIFSAWDSVDSVMFQMPTGTGKTRLFTSLIRDIKDWSIENKTPIKILVVAHRAELIDQIDATIRKTGIVPGIISASRKQDLNTKLPVQVASIQTLTSKKHIEIAEKLNVDFVIIDEAHHSMAKKTYRKLWDLYPDAQRLGVTATPWRMNKSGFTSLFNQIIVSPSVYQFIKDGVLSPYVYYSLKPNSEILNTIESIHEYNIEGDYKQSALEKTMDNEGIRAQLLDSYLKYAKGKKGIIYSISREHSRNICNEYKRKGIKIESIDGDTDPSLRKSLVDMFKRGDIDIIVNVDIFSEGFDCPDIEFIQLARPTRSLIKYLQQVGRGLRKPIEKRKDNCIILDNVGMYLRFGLPDINRNWHNYFIGADVVEEEESLKKKVNSRKRNTDTSEGDETMELIQSTEDVPNVDLEVKEGFDLNRILEDYYYKRMEIVFGFDKEHVYDYFLNSNYEICIYKLDFNEVDRNDYLKQIQDAKNAGELDDDNNEYTIFADYWDDHRELIATIKEGSPLFEYLEAGKSSKIKGIEVFAQNNCIIEVANIHSNRSNAKSLFYDYYGNIINNVAKVRREYSLLSEVPTYLVDRNTRIINKNTVNEVLGLMQIVKSDFDIEVTNQYNKNWNYSIDSYAFISIDSELSKLLTGKRFYAFSPIRRIKDGFISYREYTKLTSYAPLLRFNREGVLLTDKGDDDIKKETLILMNKTIDELSFRASNLKRVKDYQKFNTELSLFISVKEREYSYYLSVADELMFTCFEQYFYLFRIKEINNFVEARIDEIKSNSKIASTLVTGTRFVGHNNDIWNIYETDRLPYGDVVLDSKGNILDIYTCYSYYIMINLVQIDRVASGDFEDDPLIDFSDEENKTKKVNRKLVAAILPDSDLYKYLEKGMYNVIQFVEHIGGSFTVIHALVPKNNGLEEVLFDYIGRRIRGRNDVISKYRKSTELYHNPNDENLSVFDSPFDLDNVNFGIPTFKYSFNQHLQMILILPWDIIDEQILDKECMFAVHYTSDLGKIILSQKEGKSKELLHRVTKENIYTREYLFNNNNRTTVIRKYSCYGVLLNDDSSEDIGYDYMRKCYDTFRKLYGGDIKLKEKDRLIFNHFQFFLFQCVGYFIPDECIEHSKELKRKEEQGEKQEYNYVTETDILKSIGIS